MRFRWFEILGVAMIGFLLSGVFAAVGENTTVSQTEREREWYADLHDATYVQFPNGKLYKHGFVTGKWLGPMLGKQFNKLVLWHCGDAVILDTRTDKRLYMQARPIRFLDEGDKGPQYAAQCMTHQYLQHPWDVQVASR